MNINEKDIDFKIEKRVLRHEIKRFIEESVMNGTLKRGDKIVETKIAKLLGVSQSPVREAIRELEIMGLVENQPYKGTIIKKITSKDISDAYTVRANLEGLAAREAIKHITEEDIQFLKDLLHKMDEDEQNGDYREYVKHDIEFHEKIYQISQNELLIKVSKITNLSGWTYVTANILNQNITKIINKHAPILDCLIKKDPDEAENIMRNHVYNAYKKIIKEIV